MHRGTIRFVMLGDNAQAHVFAKIKKQERTASRTYHDTVQPPSAMRHSLKPVFIVHAHHNPAH